jgi:hypothetical protein
MSDFEAIDFHDAHLLRLGLTPKDGEVLLSFENVSVFFRTSLAETFDVWSYTADVALSLPASLVLEGRLPADGWVIDDRLEGLGTDPPDWREYLSEPVKVLSLAFTFNNGATLVCSELLLRLTLLEKRQLRETWRGPL